MPQLKDVMDALRKADEMGATEDAQRLAAIADKLRSAPQEESPAQNLGVLPWTNLAIAETVGAPVQTVQKGLEAIPGYKKIFGLPVAFGGTESIKRGMRGIGIRLPEEGREPETLAEHVGTTVGQVAGMLIPGGAGTRLLTKAPGLAGQIARNIYGTMVKHPYLTMASELGGGVGAGTGRYAGEELFPESPTRRAAAEMVGGVAGGMAPTIVTYAPTMIALREGKSILKRISLPFTEAGAKYRAGEFIKKQVARPEEVITEITQQSIGDLPPAVQSGEKRLVALYKSFIGQEPLQDAETIEKLSKSIITLEGEMRAMGYGSPTLLAEVTEKRVAALELSMNNRILAATDKAQKRLGALPIAERKVNESRIVRAEIERGMGEENSKVKALWADVPKDVEVGIENTRQTYKNIIDNLPAAQKGDVPGILKSSPIVQKKKISQPPESAGFIRPEQAVPEAEILQKSTVGEMQGLRSKMLEVAQDAASKHHWNKARIANNIADAILQDLDGVPGESSLKAAIAATKEFKTRFQSGVVGKILGRADYYAPAVSPDLTLDISIGRMAQKGSIDINKIAITPDAIKATERYLTRSYTDYALEGATGKINPIKSEQWIKTNEAILDQFPDLRSQLADAAEAQKVANNTRLLMEARKKTLQDPKISVSAKFLNAADMGQEIDVVFKDKNPGRITYQLLQQARKDQTGAAIQGVRGGIIDYMLEKSSIGPYNELGEQTLSGRTLLHFINSYDESVLRQAFKPEQISRMRRIGAEFAKIEAFEKTPGGKAEIELKDAASNALKLSSRIAGARIGGIWGRESAGGSLQMAQIFSGKAKDFMTWLTKDRTAQMIHDAILSDDPKLLEALLLPIDKPGVPATDRNLRILNERMNLWLAGSGSRILDDIEEERNE